MMQEVIRRVHWENSSGFPDLIIIDGGKGHLNIVLNVLKELQISNIEVLAISKGIKEMQVEKIFIQNFLIVLDLTKMILHYFSSKIKR